MKHLSKIMIIVLSLSLFGCTAAPQDKLHLLNEEPVTIELGSDLDLTLENYLDTSELSEEDLDNVAIKLVSAIKNSEGKIDPNAKEVESKELGFGSKAILITLNDEQEVIDVVVKDTTKPEFIKTKDECCPKRTLYKLNAPYIHQLRQRYIAFFGKYGVPAIPFGLRDFNLRWYYIN